MLKSLKYFQMWLLDKIIIIFVEPKEIILQHLINELFMEFSAVWKIRI